MEAFVWDNVFLTGFDDVDEQHHRLISWVNKLGEAIFTHRAGQSEVLATVLQLVNYAEYHFKEEEELMQATGIDERHLSQHRNDHAHFLDEIREINHAVSTDEDAANSLMQFLTHWLAYHILGSDQNMARQLRAIQSGASPEDAFNREELHADRSTEPLLHALNGLFRQVSDRNRELVRLNQSLEEKVAERTHALQEANTHLEAMAMTDTLTQLPNRRYAMDYLRTTWASSIERDSPLSCMMIDADGFKDINDQCGHDAGDLVLRRIAATLNTSAPKHSVTCRLGGDEFLVICPGLALPQALAAADVTLQKVTAMAVPVGDTSWLGSVSIGVASRCREMNDHNDLVKKADESVYEAKRTGKRCVRAIQEG